MQKRTAMKKFFASLDALRVAFQAKEKVTQDVIKMMEDFEKKYPDAKIADLPKLDSSLWRKIQMKISDVEDIRQAISDLKKVKSDLNLNKMFKPGSLARVFGSAPKLQRFQRIANRLTAELSKEQKRYREYFKGVMDKWEIKSPSELSDADKKKFFDEIDKGWKAGKNESDRKA